MSCGFLVRPRTKLRVNELAEERARPWPFALFMHWDLSFSSLFDVANNVNRVYDFGS